MSRIMIISFFLLLALPMSGNPVSLGPVRAAYQFGAGRAYSAAVELPSYTIVDLGRDRIPIHVNDAQTVLLKTKDRELIRWTAGRNEVLSHPMEFHSWAYLNERNSVVLVHHPELSTPEILFWDGSSPDPVSKGWGPDQLDVPYHVRPYSLNDLDQLVIFTESQSSPIPFPPHTIRSITSRANLPSGNWFELARYEYNLGWDDVLHQGGMFYEVNAQNNYGESVGRVYADLAQSSPHEPDPVYQYQYEYFAFDRDTGLDFEPLALNDSRTLLGRTAGPSHRLIILDAFGQRVISPILQELGRLPPLMSNPAGGLEEIVLGNHYLKRMLERDFRGLPTGQLSPDFWHGQLDDLIQDQGNWRNLSATCISANGRIAGLGRYWNGLTGTFEDRGFLLLKQALIPDWNRDGSIDGLDLVHAGSHLPWRFWINSDDDAGDLARSFKDDLPGQPDPDWHNDKVDGLRDLVDFFPVAIDIQPVLQALGNTVGLEVLLSQADEALNFVYTNLNPAAAGRLHTKRMTTGFGPAFNQPAENAPVHRVTSQPLALERHFLDNIRDDNRNILLFEGRSSSSSPLVMEIRYKGETAYSHELALSISPVEDMFRILNLRNCDPLFIDVDPGPWLTRLEEPPNLPDAFLGRFAKPLRTLVHVHGFNWSGHEIPAAHAQIFKRFFQMGSFARFLGVTWFGDKGLIRLNGKTLEYNGNVINAFVTAGCFRTAVDPFAGPFTAIFAHSLGNLLVSSAIVDHGLEVGNFFMVNAAVPKEAYLGEQGDRRLMVHPHWKNRRSAVPDYPESHMATRWHTLFPAHDRRSRLAWKNRFQSISHTTICHHFFSTGEEILRAGNGDLPKLFSDLWNQELIWVYNEMVKGTNSLAGFLTGDVHGGWGFNREYMTWVDPGGPAHPPPGEWIPLSTTSAGNIPLQALVQEPFFRPFSRGDADSPAWGNGDWLYQDSWTANAYLPDKAFNDEPPELVRNHAKILAQAIPAHSAPSGSSTLPNLFLLKNHDMDDLFRAPTFWPFREPANKRDRWLHSDYLHPALPFVHKLYQTCINIINYMP